MYLEDLIGDGEKLWGQLDRSVSDGGQVWLRSPLLQDLNGCLVQAENGKLWLRVEAKKFNQADRLLLRLRDILLSFGALASLSPLLFLVAVLVKRSSPGPVFYKTVVVGRDGRHFVWRKFRSMKVMAEQADVAVRRERYRAYVMGAVSENSKTMPAKIVDDQRVTKVGRFIRKYSIDELPQLFNVLTGQMSIVGPRPCLPYEAEFYTGWRSRRFNVRPGLTGVWQVFGRGRVSFDQTAAMDVYYTFARSLRLDLYLMLKTVGVVVRGRGGA